MPKWPGKFRIFFQLRPPGSACSIWLSNSGRSAFYLHCPQPRGSQNTSRHLAFQENDHREDYKIVKTIYEKMALSKKSSSEKPVSGLNGYQEIRTFKHLNDIKIGQILEDLGDCIRLVSTQHERLNHENISNHCDCNTALVWRKLISIMGRIEGTWD